MGWSQVFSLVGGVGLFLLGMRLMTDGLRLAAGSALKRILSTWTRKPLYGVFSGFLVTAAVQSSSAVTVAVIGFVNAGLLSLRRTLWVIYGSNVGTTVTGWLVALIGFNIDVKALALPMVGLGMLLNVTGNGSQRRASLGEALAGFGLFFLGIGVLKGGFAGTAGMVDLDVTGLGAFCLPAMAIIGFGLTFLMQSSSAAMALVLTAAASGAIDLECAASAVIGANLGTTSTAVLSVIGATPNAKRVAAGHVIFNLLTGAAAFLLLPVLLHIIESMRGTSAPAEVLALFHTAFNVLGVLLMWFITNRLTVFLNKRFRTTEEDLGRTRYLDTTIARTPSLAIDALGLELSRMGQTARASALAALDGQQNRPWFKARREALRRLEYEVGKFCAALQRYNLSSELAPSLPAALRSAQYYVTCGELSARAAKLFARHGPLPEAARELAERFTDEARETALSAVACRQQYDPEMTETMLEQAVATYRELKQQLLEETAKGHLDVDSMSRLLDALSFLRRALEQLTKGCRTLVTLPDVRGRCPQDLESAA